jgi:hypothetical protein
MPYHELRKVTESIPCLEHIVCEVINKTHLQKRTWRRKREDQGKRQSDHCKKRKAAHRLNVKRNRKSQKERAERQMQEVRGWPAGRRDDSDQRRRTGENECRA